MALYRDSNGDTKNQDSFSWKRSNDDDDFVKTPPVFFPVKNIAKKPISMIYREEVEDSLPCLNTRFPPERMTNTVSLLNEEQRTCVELLGFGSALTMRLGKPPRMLCYWLVDNYEPTTNTLRVHDQRLVVTREIIHDIYGIPMGDIPMSNPAKANHEDKVVRVWKSQFPKVKRIRLTHVIKKISNDTEAGPLFIQNFLVMFVSVMIGFPSMGTVNQGFLENISDDVDIHRLDWCGFVLSCLNSSRMMWNRLDDNCVYTGPIVFLLLFYLRFTKLDHALKEIPATALIHWTTERLKERESQELANGGFGNVVILSQYMEMSQSEQGDVSEDDYVGSDDSNRSEKEFTDSVSEATRFERPQEDEFNNLEEIIRQINNNFSGYFKAMKSIDEWLMRGVMNHPESEDVRMLLNKRNQEFNLRRSYFSTRSSTHHETCFDTTMTPITHRQENTTRKMEGRSNEAPFETDAILDVVHSTPFTQIINDEVFDVLEESVLIPSFKRLKKKSDSHDHCVSDLESEEENPNPLTDVVAPRRPKRMVKLTDKLRSPNFIRVIDPNTGLNSIEKRVSGMIFAGLDNEGDLLFESTFGDIGYRAIFESMLPGLMIHVTIIDIWATILNHQEQHRNKKSPSRMFISSTLLANYVLDETISIDKRYKKFRTRMNEHVEKYKSCTNFNDVDLVFFPVITSEHYYLIVFNLKKCSCVIIDNIYSNRSLYVAYGNIPFDLDVLFKLYLESLKHPKKSKMMRVSPMKLNMDWMTKRNYTDCGVFLMRHMETYKGQDVDDWNIKLEPESENNDDQQIQLDDLRKKYVTKILNSDMNIHKPTVYSYLPAYDKLPDEEKMKFNTREHLERIERRIGLFY